MFWANPHPLLFTLSWLAELVRDGRIVRTAAECGHIVHVYLASNPNSTNRAQFSEARRSVEQMFGIRMVHHSRKPIYLRLCWLALVVATQAISNVVRSSFGPAGLDKMMVDDIGVCRRLSSHAVLWLKGLGCYRYKWWRYDTESPWCRASCRQNSGRSSPTAR